VEDYFQVQAFAGTVAPADWEIFPRRVEANTDRLLALFAEAGAAATFFTLGWVAERHGPLIRRIVAGGHELASHGHWHQRVDGQTEHAFAEDVARARAVLEDAGGVAVSGYRAPTFSIGARTPWAHEVLARTGHRYSSSTYPVRHDLYGDPSAPRAPFRTASGVWELPMTTWRAAGRNLPCSGGGYFRLLPYAAFRFLLRRSGPRGIFYTHPWELDADQPRIAAAPLSRFRHYTNLHRTEARLSRLLRDFACTRLDAAFADLLAG
jgi:polysaccharide deacetylase family protein (PEP-CTERM system associated)